MPERTSILHLAPWVDYGGSDKGTIDWFRWIDRGRFRPSLITTQPSPNRRIAEVVPYADEIWVLPELLEGPDFAPFILGFVESRAIPLVHIMNSRLGFLLLPDFAALPRRPQIVVQLHVEEPDKSGYVRYVTTRYGNLVDAFSVSSQHLADAVYGYEVSRDKIHVIPTGVDAETEFSPERVMPVELEPNARHILFPGRLVEQKDPFLMADVVAALAKRRSDIRVHVVGEGHLEASLRSRLLELQLDKVVSLHGPTASLAPWYAACDLVLMTSMFEGVPYIAYEAMAMATPIVAPALPGNVELMDGVGGILIEERCDVEAYAEALERLLDDDDVRTRIGQEGRERVRKSFSLTRIGEEYGRLYANLLLDEQTKATVEWRGHRRLDLSEQVLFRSRPSQGAPLVSVIVPCFNHGRYLSQCLDSVRAQSYPAIETIVVDDGSRDRETMTLLDQLELDPTLTVIRLEANRGPSAARNTAIERSRGRFVLPLDADNVLLPDAIERLVMQLQSAGERVGFIYPNLHYFGNADAVIRVPPYNLRALLDSNYCDTCSLFDREIFCAGLRFNEELVVGHEDWDFVLQLAEHGVYGEPAEDETVLVRKHGFTRCDLVDYRLDGFSEGIRRSRPRLYKARDTIKCIWSPELSIVALADVDWTCEAGRRLLTRLEAQTCCDFEFVAPSRTSCKPAFETPVVRRLAPELDSLGGGILGAALAVARGRYVLIADDSATDFLADPTFAEKILRGFIVCPELDAMAFAVDARANSLPFSRLCQSVGDLDVRAVALRIDRDLPLPGRLSLVSDRAPRSIVRALNARGARVEWRHAPARPRLHARGDPIGRSIHVVLPVRRPHPFPPALPSETEAAGSGASSPWLLAGTVTLFRHRKPDGSVRVVTNEAAPPPGFALEYTLGLVHKFSPPGTRKLFHDEDGFFRTWEPGAGEQPPGRSLGSIEVAPLPLLAPLWIAATRGTGHHTLVNAIDDPLLAEVNLLESVGFIEPWPLRPAHPPLSEIADGLTGLVRAVDGEARRHVYAAGIRPQGELVGELGSLHAEPQEDSIALWVGAEGLVRTEAFDPTPERPDVRTTARWVAAPLRWWGARRPIPRLRAVARRLSLAPRYLRTVPSSSPAGSPAGYLLRLDGQGRLPIHAAIHPVTGDELLTHYPLEAQDMGYVRITLLGYVRALAPVTGTLELTRPSLPWASRFGLEARRQ